MSKYLIKTLFNLFLIYLLVVTSVLLTHILECVKHVISALYDEFTTFDEHEFSIIETFVIDGNYLMHAVGLRVLAQLDTCKPYLEVSTQCANYLKLGLFKYLKVIRRLISKIYLNSRKKSFVFKIYFRREIFVSLFSSVI